jgi:outer membrane lipoprotein-sorting protein
MIRRFLPALLLVMAVALGSGCIVRKLRITRRGARPTAQLATASLDDLLRRISALDQQVRTINASVDIEPSIGTVNKGEISEYTNVPGYILIRKPGMFRMIGLAPVARTKIFDMVTDSVDFKIYFPTKSKLFIGKNHMDAPSPKKLENIRPQHVYDALVVHPLAQGERAVLENHTDEAEASYIVHVIRGGGIDIKLDRNLWFERVGLHLSRQVLFDEHGDIITDARYDDYKPDQGVDFPRVITVTRPLDEYGVKLTIQKLDLNKEIRDDQFVLSTPQGTEVVDMQQPRKPAPGGPR